MTSFLSDPKKIIGSPLGSLQVYNNCQSFSLFSFTSYMCTKGLGTNKVRPIKE